MCGIAGIQRFDGQPVGRQVLDAMVATLDHRGPDANGIELRGSVGLGHTRLSIIDLSGGVQPMVLEDDELIVTFNGEIFNYIELRQELIAHGRRFTTTSDTEVLLQAYAQWGEDCVQHFNGQWAFAIWDARRKKLFLSRDRFGKLPLFYTVSGKTFLFSSEVKAIFAHPGVSKAIDPVGLDQLCTFWSAQPPRTIFAGINLLPPGHSLTVQDCKLTVARYWDLDFSETLDNVPARELEEQLLDLLTKRLATTGKVVEHPLAHLLCFKDHLASLLLARFNNCRSFSLSAFALSCSVLPDLFGDLLGFFSTPSN